MTCGPPQQKQLFDSQPPAWELDDAEERLVARVVFADPPHGPLDYRVPESLRGCVEPGKRLMLPLGRSNRGVSGYCVAVERQPTVARSLKDVLSVLDAAPLIDLRMLELTDWIAETYLCPWGRVLESVVPAGVRAGAGTRRQTYLYVPTSVAARITQLQLPPKQAEALRCLLNSPDPLTVEELATAIGSTAAPIQGLRKKGLLREETRQVWGEREPAARIAPDDPPELNADQQHALEHVGAALSCGEQRTILLYGVTGSGKTEVYLRAIQEVIRRGQQAIVLVPEISLTPQTVTRFRSRLQHVAVLHSRLSNGERHWHWQRIARGEVNVVVGARSAIFAPTPRLGLVVLDEEHDGSFKQDTAPHYHARDVALRRTQALGVPLLLGSATPSLESWHRTLLGEYQRVDLPTRVMDRALPRVQTIDLRLKAHDRSSRGAISRPLHQGIAQALQGGGQVILLLNRRGFSTHIQCPGCGHVVRCPACDIALTHHRTDQKAVCHYCDYHQPAPDRCPKCQFDGLRYAGLGTQRLEAEVRARFPSATCLRMDSDTMRAAGSHERALDQFRRGAVQILLGTQMIAKGLDFPNVTLVGVIQADTALHLPDFRAAERTFQLVAQVAGRTGRGERGGHVLVQTFSPEHPAIRAAAQHDYLRFATDELMIRQQFHYPPYSRMIRAVVRGPQATTAARDIAAWADRMRIELERRKVEARVLGPSEAPIAKLRDKWRFHLLLQSLDGPGMLQGVRAATEAHKGEADVQRVVDVDPLDML